ncbi:RHS repeat-associated core domain-containing protein [Kribbella sp. HUAS MG21]|uniref:RHS repeat-associated core domain-containing protein n=1 Tax=Kribbella sp. HUAS MG21 TaxID=3160966 RepID=A0AAU7T8M7_9ACTN
MLVPFTGIVTAVALAASGLVDIPAARADAGPSNAWRPAAQAEFSVPGHDLAPRSRPADPQAASVLRQPPQVSRPEAGEAEVSLPRDGTTTQAGRLPVRVGAGRVQGAALTPVNQVRVRVHDHSAAEKVGASGMLFSVGRTDLVAGSGQVKVEVDYSAFRSAYGGDWASRLRLVRLPACALTTPDKAGCSDGQVLTSSVTRDNRIATEIAASNEATVLALTSAPAGSAGSYKPTALSASASWNAGGSSGAFSWGYSMDGPESLGGPEPDLNLGYSSGAIDGRVASTNNQSSWVGEGWGLDEGFVERRYTSCADEVKTTPKPQDLCWETDNAYLVLGGTASELVRDDATGVWKLRDDDGSRLERLTAAVNGDNDGEHWRLTSQDGTQYYFGLNRLPGWATGNEETGSVWTAPVFGNDAAEPCHGTSFAASYCTQAWRWNLDYVVDRNGNAMSYFYDSETNYYGRNLTATAGTQYERGGYLKRVDYGQRSTSMYSAPAPMRVTFTVDERCAAGATCGTGDITSANAANWPDVPYDQNCSPGKACTGLYSPTFWTRKRLATVTTQLWVSGTTYRDAMSWALGYQFRDPGDGTSPALWLASITATGKVGGTASLPTVSFQGVQLANRVDAAEGIPPMYKWRLTDVYDEAGGHIHVNYSAADCTAGSLPEPSQNTKRCFPQYWQADGSTSLTQDWFHKYVPVTVLEDDQSGVAGTERTDYEYLGGGAWHYDDNELTPLKYRTWGQWRGYGRVRQLHGNPGETRSQEESLYLRGMDGDKLPNGGTRAVSVTDSLGGTITDHPALAGFERESLTYSEAGGSVLEGEIIDPLVSSPTATQVTRNGTIRAYMVNAVGERSREALSSGGWRNTETRTTYDSYGLEIEENDLGDTAKTGDEECTRTTYARNTSAWLIDFEAREQTVSVACTATPSYPADAVSDDLTYYDGSTTLGAAPTKGDETLTKELASYSGSTPVYTQEGRTVYDSYGRPVETYDQLDRKSSAVYTPASGAAVTTVAVTNPAGHLTTTTVEPAFGESVAEVDLNGRRTDTARDPLGRITAVWLPDRSKAAGKTPNIKYSYLIRQDAPSVITTEEVRDDGTYEASYDLYDGQLRERQTQDPAADGGRIVTDTFYDARGLEVKSNGAYWNEGTAGTTLLTGVSDSAVPGQDVTVYDGAERETVEIFRSRGFEKWRTTTTYGGDRISVDPPEGETATTSITDADDAEVELRQYTGGSPTGPYDATTYTYNNRGDLVATTDPAGNTWNTTYDLRGRVTQREDPDTGKSSFTYDNAGQVLTSTDARGATLAYTYDAMGRRTGMFDGSTSGTKRAQWTYDTLVSGTSVKGMLASSTRFVSGNAYTTSIDAYDIRYRPLTKTVTIPTSEGALAGSYKTNTGYTATGLPSLVSFPAAGGLAAETLRYGYDAAGRLQTASSGLGTMLTAATYTPYDEVAQSTLSAAAGKQLVHTAFYDDATRNLDRVLVDRSTAPEHLADVKYTYDAAGNITKIADTPQGGPSDVQCFKYDYLRRLTEAWTPAADCAAAPGVLSGPAPYRQGWTYDKTGNRLSETNHDPVTGTATTSNYTYPAAGGPRPHALANVATGTRNDTFTYDAVGNTTARNIAGKAQTLAWDVEGNLAGLTEGGQTTSYLYDADGDRLIARDAEGSTLYLDNSEVHRSPTDTVTVTRYYDLGAAGAVRNESGLNFTVADHHGTNTLSVNATDLSPQQRRFTPFGAPRGAKPSTWPDNHGYVDGVDDSTGLTHLGAREYDSARGRFISTDPVADFDNPQQLNGYAYADNTPITAADPDGEWRVLPGGHYCDGCGGYNKAPKKKKKAAHKKAKAKKAKHYCDGCDYQRYLAKKKKKERIAAAKRAAKKAAAKRAAQKAAKLKKKAAKKAAAKAKKKKEQRKAKHRAKTKKASILGGEDYALVKVAGAGYAICRFIRGTPANTCAVLGSAIGKGQHDGGGWYYVKWYVVARGSWTLYRVGEIWKKGGVTPRGQLGKIKGEFKADGRATRRGVGLWMLYEMLSGDTRSPRRNEKPKQKTKCVVSWKVWGKNVFSIC